MLVLSCLVCVFYYVLCVHPCWFRMAIKPLPHPKIVKKHVKKWHRHQSDRYVRLGDKWRKPKGIDNRVRRRFKGQMRMPKIGYRTARRVRHIHPDGFKHVLINNVKVTLVVLICDVLRNWKCSWCNIGPVLALSPVQCHGKIELRSSSVQRSWAFVSLIQTPR